MNGSSYRTLSACLPATWFALHDCGKDGPGQATFILSLGTSVVFRDLRGRAGPRLLPLSEHAEALRDRDQFCQRLHFHLLHYLMAMRLDGTLGRSQFMGDLLVELAAHDETEHLAFARSKNCHQRLHLLDLVPFAARRRVTRQRALDDAEQ